jgi:Aspartyl protease
MKCYFGSSPARFTLLVSVLVFLLPLQTSAQQSDTSASVPKPQPQTRIRFTSGNSSLKIPLEIDNKIILIRVSVNGSKPLKFIFDTGASASIISAQRAADLGLKTKGEAKGTATGGKIQGSFIEGVSLSVQGAEVSDQTIGAFTLPMPPGFEFDGIIGYDFINQFVVELDYLNKTMNLHNPGTYQYSGKGEVIPLILGGRTPLARTKIILERRAPLEARLEVDTGGDNTFVIYGSFVKKKKLVEATQQTNQETRRGAGGEEQVVNTQFKAAQLGSFVFKNPPAELALNTERGDAGEDGLIGGEILRRFKVILDYSRQQMILEPNKNFDDPYDLEGDGD